MTAAVATTDQPREEMLRSALAASRRPSRANALTASLVFGWRALLKIRYVPEQLFDAVLTPVILTLIITYILGGALAGSTGQYLQYFLPGILVYAVLFMTVYTGFSLNTDLTRGVADRFRSLPVWRPAVIVGALLGDAARYLLGSAIVLALGLALGFRPEGGVAGVLLSVALVLAFAFSLSWVWTMLGLILRSPMAVYGAANMVLFPLAFASNIFVDPRTMPRWLQRGVDLNPITHLTTAVRALMAGTLPTGEIGRLLIGCAAFILFFAPITMHLYRNKT